MGYYMAGRGDFYANGRRGDFYMGDPGFWSFLKGAAGSLLSAVPGGGSMSKVAHAIGGTIRPAAARMGKVVMEHPVLTAAGAAGVIGMGAGAGVEALGRGGPGMRGFHPCKSRHGCKRGAWVRNRHMRVTNPRALKRALRRVGGFGRLASRVMRLTHPHRRGKLAFRFPKRKKA